MGRRDSARCTTEGREPLTAALRCVDLGPATPPTMTDSPASQHPDLIFHVDVTLTEHQARWLAVAMLADEPDVGTGADPREALRAALAALGEPYASELAASAELRT